MRNGDVVNYYHIISVLRCVRFTSIFHTSIRFIYDLRTTRHVYSTRTKTLRHLHASHNAHYTGSIRDWGKNAVSPVIHIIRIAAAVSRAFYIMLYFIVQVNESTGEKKYTRMYMYTYTYNIIYINLKKK